VQADESETTTQRWTYLYILHQRVVGVASAQPLQHGFNLLDNNLDRSTAKQKAVVGIHQIWVHSKFRRQGIASLLVDALREKMVYGLVIPREHVAFSSPTLAGAAFARKYVAGHSSLSGQDSLCPVLVYDCG
jgi:ribosomal protein S18 acetylase RimI-like enzyme